MSSVPASVIIDAQLRVARARIEAGEPVPATLVIVGVQDSMVEVIPDVEDRERWLYNRGYSMNAIGVLPRAALLVEARELQQGLFETDTCIIIAYQDVDGLQRSIVRRVGNPDGFTDAHVLVKSPAELSQFWAGYVASRRQAAANRQQGRRPSWRFRR